MKSLFTCFIVVLSAQCLQAQNVGIGTSNPNSSAMLEINSSTKGLLLPRVADTSSVPSPAKGLVIYSNSNNKLWYYDGNRWQQNVANAGGMDSIWYKTRDSIAYTEKPYVAVNADHDLIDPQANLQVNGSLLVQGKMAYSLAAPTAAQIYTMTNSPSIQNIAGADSVCRVYDPGGTGNYNNNMLGNVTMQTISFQDGAKVSSVASDFGLGTGDTLWVANTFFPNCRTNYSYRFTNTSTNPADFIISTAAYFIFRSNNDGSNGKGFNFIVTRLFNKNDYSKRIQTAGPALWFNPLSGSFGAGTNCEANIGGVALGSYAKALSNGIALGNNARAEGTASFAGGYYALADGPYTVSFRGAAYGAYSIALGSTANGDYSLAWGQYSEANGLHAVVMGPESHADADYSFVAGHFSSASGHNSTALGYSSESNGSFSSAMGNNLEANGYGGTVVGMNNDPLLLSGQTTVNSYTPLFIVGNGDNSSSRSNALVVLKSGNVGIGLPGLYPEERLHVGGGNILVDNTSNTTIELQAAGVDKGFVQLSGNNLRVGTNSSNTTGNFVVRTNGADQLTIFPTGNATLAGILTQSSDARFKESILPIGNALDKLMRLNGYTYYWKPELKKDDRRQIGLIAQNVETVLPELVSTDATGMKSVAYQNLVPVLIEAMKEQQQQIEELKKKLKQAGL